MYVRRRQLAQTFLRRLGAPREKWSAIKGIPGVAEDPDNKTLGIVGLISRSRLRCKTNEVSAPNEVII